MAVVTFFLRPQIRVNVDIHRIGRVGEIAGGIREYVVDFERDLPIGGPGWIRIGGTVEIHFTDKVIDEIEADPAFEYAVQQIALGEDRDTAGERSLVAINMFDMAVRSLEPALRILTAAIAVEALLSDGEEPSTTARIARRIAYLTCGAGCGRTTSLCPSIDRPKTLAQIKKDVFGPAEDGLEWQCSAFLRVAAPNDLLDELDFLPLFAARNAVAHEGRFLSDERETRELVSTAHSAILETLRWMAANEGADPKSIDDCIS